MSSMNEWRNIVERPNNSLGVAGMKNQDKSLSGRYEGK